jgi:hypothetical protein
MSTYGATHKKKEEDHQSSASESVSGWAEPSAAVRLYASEGKSAEAARKFTLLRRQAKGMLCIRPFLYITHVWHRS